MLTHEIHPEVICAILVGKAKDNRKAQSMARAARACPFVALYEARADEVVAVFTLPKSQQEWLEYPTEKPNYLDGLDKVVTVLTDQIQASSPWTRGDTHPTATEAPCKRRCDKCSRYQRDCSGCPATIFFMAAE